MFFKKLKVFLKVFLCTSMVLGSFFTISFLYEEKSYLEKELIKYKEEVSQLNQELEKINNYVQKINKYAKVYRTTPEIIAMVTAESEKYNLNPTIMLELIRVESNFDSQAISKVGAKGLCQINPRTAQELARELKLEYSEEKLFDDHYNIQLGTYYLAKLLKEYNMDYHKALTAYNRGPTGLANFMKTRGTAVSRYSQKISSRSQQLAYNNNY
ncbi:MAG: lytic transglycosylase domain-containing protein [Clostridia bacterium]|nr:lytic transglycosylase domain-containing protein [Clostridia bacterium]